MLALGALGYKRGVPFRGLLERLVKSERSARGAIFCDHEGEAVALSLAEVPPRGCAPIGEYDLKVCGAQMAAPVLALMAAAAAGGAGPPKELRMLCEHGTLACRVLRDGYYVALLLAPGGRSAGAPGKLAAVSALVLAEM